MLQSAGAAAEEFRRRGARACTDVTGFGLLGHLLEMLRASEKSAELVLPDVPILDGAAACVAEGIFSSLHPENLKFGQEAANAQRFAGDPGYLLLFDPAKRRAVCWPACPKTRLKSALKNCGAGGMRKRRSSAA